MTNHKKKKYHEKKSKLVPFLLILSTLVAFMIVTIFLLTKQAKKQNSTNPALSGQSPTRTSLDNGYISSSSAPAALGTATLVDDTGPSQWVQIKSSKKGNKFTDLSSGGIKIIKANNPQILKTTTSLQSPAVLMSAVVAQYPDTAIMNASGFNTDTGAVAGFQINNGKVFQDWGASGQSTFVVNSNGTCVVYDSTTPASEIIQKGAAMSFTFASILINNGVITPSDGSFDWKKHSLIGNDKENNIYLIVTDTNYGYDRLMKAISSYNMENLIQMDGGGSSQLSLKGQTLFPSEDNRAVPDYIVLK